MHCNNVLNVLCVTQLPIINMGLLEVTEAVDRKKKKKYIISFYQNNNQILVIEEIKDFILRTNSS